MNQATSAQCEFTYCIHGNSLSPNTHKIIKESCPLSKGLSVRSSYLLSLFALLIPYTVQRVCTPISPVCFIRLPYSFSYSDITIDLYRHNLVCGVERDRMCIRFMLSKLLIYRCNSIRLTSLSSRKL